MNGQFKNISWFYATLAMMPLSYIMYYILKLNLIYDKASGILGVLILLSFSQFFFFRRNYIYRLSTILLFYCIGLIGAFIVSYTQAIWLLLFFLYAFYLALVSSSTFTDRGEKLDLSIKKEKKNRPWYKWIIAVPSQQIENKLLSIDIAIFFVVVILALLVRDYLI